MSRAIAFATYAARPEGEADDYAAADALRAQGIDVTFAVWNDDAVDWSGFDAVVVRSTWDYYHHLDAFLAWTARVDACTRLFNARAILESNVDKTYLRRLEKRGIPIVPTVWPRPGNALADVLDGRGWNEAVVKPAVSAGAFETFRVRSTDAGASQDRFAALLHRGAVLVQPFLPQIAAEGEWSLVFFDGAYSHAVVKRPKAGDFRVQARHGGREESRAAPPGLVAQAQAVLTAMPDAPLYARVDGVVEDGVFLLMEIELVEPALFLTHGHAAARFADALVARLG